MNDTMKKPLTIYYIALFLGMIFVPMVITGFLRKQAFKEELLYLNAEIHTRILHMSSSDDVILGKDGWMFYKGRQDALEDPLADYLGTNLFTEEELQIIAGNMERSAQKAKEHGAEFIVVLAPDKERIYYEYLPDSYDAPATDCRLKQVADYLRKHTDVTVIDATEALRTYHAAYPDDRIFIKHDTHWNHEGAYLAAREIMLALGREMPPLEELSQIEVQPPEGDLSRLMGFGDHFQAEPEEMLAGYADHLPSLEYENTFEHAWSNAADMPYRSLLVAGDSFSVGFLQYLACHFSHTYMNFHYNYNEQMIEEHQPDVIVYEVLERFLSYMLTFEL